MGKPLPVALRRDGAHVDLVLAAEGLFSAAAIAVRLLGPAFHEDISSNELRLSYYTATRRSDALIAFSYGRPRVRNAMRASLLRKTSQYINVSRWTHKASQRSHFAFNQPSKVNLPKYFLDGYEFLRGATSSLKSEYFIAPSNRRIVSSNKLPFFPLVISLARRGLNKPIYWVNGNGIVGW